MTAPLIASALSLLALIPSQPAQTVVYGTDAGDQPSARTVSGGSWGAAFGLSDLSGVFTGAVCRPSPIEDLLALLTTDENGRLTMHLRDDGTWGGDSTIETSVGGTGAELADAAFEQRSGRLLIAYRDGQSADVSYRVYDGTLYGAQSVDLGLPGAPVAVRLAPQPGTDRVAIVAATASSLHAAVWNGDTWDGIVTLDSAYDGGADGFDVTCETHSGVPVVCWARSTDSSLRVRRWDGETWAGETSGPSVGAPIARVVLTPDRDAEGDTILAAVASSSGDAQPLHAALWDGSAWGAIAQLSADLEGTAYPFGAAWERQGGCAVVAWADDGDTTVRARRWNGSAWGGETNAGDTQQTIGSIEVRTSDSSDARAFVVACAHEASAGNSDYFDYVAYSDGGGVDQSGVSYSGPTGQQEPGVDLPPVPDYSSGHQDLDLPSDGFGSGDSGSFDGGGHGHGHGDTWRNGSGYEDSAFVEVGYGMSGNGGSGFGGSESDTVSLDPGSYGDLTVAKDTTVRFSTGQYVFQSVDLAKEVTFECDTSSGDVIIVVEDGFDADKEFTIENSGSYAVIIHVVDGDFQADKNAEIEAAIVVHSGDIEFAKDAEITGYLLASGDIDFNGSSDVSAPAWNFSSPTYSSGGGIDRLWSVAISLGSPNSLIELTPSAGWTEPSSLPFALSESVPERTRVRVTRWREEQPE